METGRAGNEVPGAPTTHTAILIMHGVGEQNPYETLDSFAQGFARHFIGQTKRFVIRPERIAHADWTEAAVHLEFDTPATERGLERLSVFEFYWARYIEGKVTYRGVLSWLVRTTLTPLRYLGDNLQALLAVQTSDRRSAVLWLFVREILGGALVYLPLALLIAWVWFALSRSGQPLVDVASEFGRHIGKERHRLALGVVVVCWTMAVTLGAFLARRLWNRAREPGATIDRVADRIWYVCAAISFLAFAVAGLVIVWWREVDLEPYGALVLQRNVLYAVSLALVALYLRRILVGYLGDVTVYVAADHKEASFKARSAILKESGAALTRLLKGRRYDQVILAGHSLGSAIAYDTINELLSQVWAAPDQVGQGPHSVLTRPDLAALKGLVTFGSPLDKIFYFLREHVEPKQAIRAQILSFLHSFRRGPSGRDYGDMRFTYTKSEPPGTEPSAFPVLAGDSRWLNVWSPMDPVSGRLKFYRLEDSDRLCRWYPIWGAAHLAYWSDTRSSTSSWRSACCDLRPKLWRCQWRFRTSHLAGRPTHRALTPRSPGITLPGRSVLEMCLLSPSGRLLRDVSALPGH